MGVAKARPVSGRGWRLMHYAKNVDNDVYRKNCGMSGDDDDIIRGCHGNTNDPSLLGQLNEEDEVKVHVLVDIEEGELSSGEEGEIKG